METRIKFVDLERQFGFAHVEGKPNGAHFWVSDFLGRIPSDRGEDRPIDCEVWEDERGFHARNIRLLDEEASDLHAWENPGALGRAMTLYAWFPEPFETPDKIKVSSPLHRLADITLDEPWHFGKRPPLARPFPILWNYLSYSFVRLSKQDRRAATSPSEANLRVDPTNLWATFNTGLVDHLYEPVFALFRRNTNLGAQPWVLHDFCVPGQGKSGQDLVALFNPLPEPPRYFTNASDMLLNTDQPIHIEAHHVIVDGIKRDRFPYEFLRRQLQPSPPKGYTWEDYSRSHGEPRETSLDRLAKAVEKDPQAQRSIKNRLDDARDLAVKRTKWNFKTAIPSYYPREDEVSLLLPLCLVDDQNVDVALVVSRHPSGVYQGQTIYPLDWAYEHARLVCRPDSDWLAPIRITHVSAEEDVNAIDQEGEDKGREDEMKDDPFSLFIKTHKVDEWVECRVSRVTDHGALVTFPNGARGAIHVSAMREKGEFLKHPSDRVSVGQTISARIDSIDEQERRIALSLLKADDQPEG